KLRSALSDSADNPRYIETIPRRGYRFVAPVAALSRDSGTPGESRTSSFTEIGNDSTADLTAPVPRSKPGKSSAWKLVGAFALLLTVVAAAVIVWRIRTSSTASTAAPIRSLAVLPLENLSGDSDDYFADGMTDELITDLAQIGALRVISRSSVM